MKYKIEEMRPTRLEINLETIKKNTRWFRSHIPAGCRLMVVVKANAYGHGSLEISKTVLEGGADMLGVATLDEALHLRNQFKKIPVLVLGPLEKKQILSAIKSRFVLTVSDKKHLEWLVDIQKKYNRKAVIHLKLNTGMQRLGISTDDELSEIVKRLKKYPGITLSGIYSHFFAADSHKKGLTLKQMTVFKDLVQKNITNHSKICYHIANTAGLLRFPESSMDMVRIGIGIYGYPPSPRRYKGLEPALSLKTRVIAIQRSHKDDFISYGDVPLVKRRTVIGVIPVGYADGWLRCLSNKFTALVRGKRVRGIGNICMDMSMLDVTSVKNIKIGDEVVLIGKQKNNVIHAEEVAGKANTIVYEVLTSFSDRLPRYYTRSNRSLRKR